MIRSRDEHYVDEFEGCVTVRSIYGETVGVFDSTEAAQEWIDDYRARWNRAAAEYNKEQK